MAESFAHLQAALADRYTIEREIGRGGMAVVYLAHDLKHDRPVAVKVLRPEVAVALGSERFLREIHIAARLNHPHILPLHDSGHADGILYYVMPFVEGESLRDRMTREGQLPLEESLQITREVGSALSYAHAHDVVHRDVKPENILLSGGVALVADFGIARAITSAAGDQVTSTGVSVGTPTYMSPEQATGQAELDGRSDQYSLACVLYEMLAGAPPFTGPNQQAVLARHAIDPVPSLRTLRVTVPPAVEQAVVRALAKSPADRFPTIEEFQGALTRPTLSRSTRRRVGQVALYATVAVALIVAASFLLTHRRAEPGESARAIAVLPFDNIGGDSSDEYFGDGMAEELIAALSKIPGLHVAARTSAFSFKHKPVAATAIGRALQVGTLLEGTVRRSGTRIRVHAELINATDGFQLWSDEYERDVRDVFAVQDEIARAIVSALQVRLSGADNAAIVRPSTMNPEAHDLYQQGRYFYAKRDSASLSKAQEYFARAIRIDSSYALAWSGLSDAYSHSSVFGYVAPRDIFPQAKAAALRALALDSTLVEVHTSLGFIALFYDWDWATAGRELDRALRIDPRYAEAHLFHGWYFVATNRIDDAVAEVQTAVKLDPFSLVNNARLASMLFYARRYNEMLGQARHLLELDSTNFQGRAELARAYLLLGRCAESLATLKQAPEPAAALFRGFLGYAYARCGHRTQALAQLKQFGSEVRAGRYVSHIAFARIFAGLGDTERALAELDSAYAERAWTVFALRMDPLFDGLRADPRFARLVKKVGRTS